MAKIKSVGITFNPKRLRIGDIVSEIVEALAAKSIKAIIPESLPDVAGVDSRNLRKGDLKDSQMIITLGGDGTLLRLAREIYPAEIPILGVNIGTLGFLAQVSRDAVLEALDRVLAGDFHVRERMLIEVHLLRNGEEIFHEYGLNEMVISKEALSRIINLSVSVNDIFTCKYRSDGVIISTPTGSTAHNLSAGGPIVHPEVSAMIMVPICAHTLTNRPLVIPGESSVEVKLLKGKGDEGAFLTVDGSIGHPLYFDDVIRIRRAPKTLHMIMNPEIDYFQILRTKLKWGGSM